MNGQPSSGTNTVLNFILTALAIGLTLGIGYVGYKLFMGEMKMPAILGGKSDGQSSSSSGNLFSGIPSGPTDSDPDAVSSSGYGKDDQPAVSGAKWFPLKRVYGADLHDVNPYVKDLQQFLNKFKGTQLDIDGAFGQDTEIEVKKAFGGETEISMNDYNIAIAPHLGKPQVK